MADIVICAAQSVTRAGLSAMATMATTEVTGQVKSLRALSKWLQTQRADVAVVELSARAADELSAIFNIVETFSEEALSAEIFLDEERLSVLGLVDDVAAIAPTALLQLIATGAVSLVPLAISTSDLRNAITAILSGFTVFHPDITEALLLKPDITSSIMAFSPLASIAESPPEAATEPLTPREIQVLNQLAGGLTNKAIATALYISEHTVKFHISAILSKLNAASRTEAVAVGIRVGLVML